MGLVLNRRIGETIVIDGDTRITITGFHRGQAQIYFEAPPHESRIPTEKEFFE
jgi:carbon storage regulator CsrA